MLERLIHAALLVPLDNPDSPFCRWGLPLLLWGKPGIGKSERVIIGSMMAGLDAKTIYAPRFMPDDPSGALAPDGQGDVKVVCTITAVKELKELGAGVLFIDELSSAKDATQASFLGVVLDRDIANERMNGRIRILSAANPPDIAANGRDLVAPFANRLCHIQVQPPTAKEWSEWLLNDEPARKVDLVQNEDIVKTRWKYEFARARTIFARGILVNATLLHDMPTEDSGNRGFAWPSPRTWEFACRAYATVKCLYAAPDEEDAKAKQQREEDARVIYETLLEGCVGEAAAQTFLKWLNDQDLPEPKDVLKNGFTPDKFRMDRAFIVYNSVTQFVIANKSDHKQFIENGVALWKIFQVAEETGGMLDITTDCINLAVKNGLKRDADPRIAAIATPILKRIGDTAGLLELSR